MKPNINPNSNENLSEKIEDYYTKKSSETEAHELENLALEDDFIADAMEGLDAFPEALSSIPTFPEGKNFTGYYIVGSTLLVSFFIWFLLMNPLGKNTTNIAQNTTIEEAVTQKNIETKIPDNTKLVLNTTKTKGSEVEEEIKKETPIEKEIGSKREYFDLQKEELAPLKWESKQDYDLARTKTKLIGFHNYLAVDYSVIYTNSQKFDSEVSGILADRENGDSKEKFGEKNVIESTFSYKEYLKKSLGYLKNKNYILASENFHTILKHYPEDVNAQFYLGYILYFQNKHEDAIIQMDKVIGNSFDFFSEDAIWYKANALQKTGKLKKAAILFKKIKAEGGYYSFQIK